MKMIASKKQFDTLSRFLDVDIVLYKKFYRIIRPKSIWTKILVNERQIKKKNKNNSIEKETYSRDF